MKIKNLLLNNRKNPIGFHLDFLNFSWELDGFQEEVIESVRITVAAKKDIRKVLHDSGIMKSFKSMRYLANMEINPRTEYCWTVEVKVKSGERISESSYFETGKMQESWDADWITATNETTEIMPVLYKDFSLPLDIEYARLYILGVGLYEAYLNGVKIGNEYLSPGYHSYDMHLECQTYQIDRKFFSKENRIEIILGEGWFKGRFGFDGQYRNIYGDKKKVIAELILCDTAGKVTRIPTDTSWMAEESSVRNNGIYDGETIDESINFQPLKVIKLEDYKGNIVDRFNLPITKQEKYNHVNMHIEKDGSYVYDFGKILTGWVEIEANFEAGQKIEILYGEVLQGGKFYNDNLRTAKAYFGYTSTGGTCVARPHFTFYGFRYIKLSGIKEERIKSISAFSLMSVLEETGFIETSNEKVNKLFENTKQSQKCNFVDIPTDCPQRDERMGWTGDVTVFSETANYHMDCQNFFDHYLINLQKEQEVLNGSVPFFVPNPKLNEHENINPFYVTSGVAVWGDVATVLPWNLYIMYGNKLTLKRHYPIMKAWIEHVSEVVETNVVPYLWQNEEQLGDWLALDNGNIYNPIGLTDRGMIASAYYFQSVLFTRNAARELGYDEANKLTSLLANIKKSFINEFYDGKGVLKVPVTQTACSLLLNLELYPLNRKHYLVTELERVIRENNFQLNTGFVGTYQLLPALSKFGLNDLAYKLLLNEEYPSWLYEVNLGATTIWERWNSLLADGTISGTDMNSLNHYAYGCVAGWMYKYMCGFRPQMHEKIKMILQPCPNNAIDWVKSSWKSVVGIYRMEWKKINGRFIYKVEVPIYGNAKMIFENGKEIFLKSGTYTFDYNGNPS